MDFTLTQAGLEAVEEALVAAIDSEVPLLNDASRHILTSGGKHLRPHIAMLAYLAVGGEDLMEAVPMAAAVEMVHTATLVHDDINDHSLLRRGRPSVHARWGRTFALLTGDYMFAKVYQLMAPFGADYNVIMANACTQLVEGETLQAVSAKAGEIDRGTYKRIVALKTASLFEASARMGALIGGGTPSEVNALANYAYNLGIAFQVVDDILDVVGDPVALGKPVGADLSQGRGAFIAQGERAILTLQPAVEVAVEEDDPIQRMMAKLRTSGAIEMAQHQAAEMVERARRALEPIGPSPARDELEALTNLVLERDR